MENFLTYFNLIKINKYVSYYYYLALRHKVMKMYKLYYIINLFKFSKDLNFLVKLNLINKLRYILI